MMPQKAQKKNWQLFRYLATAVLGMALCASALPAAAQQNQPDEIQPAAPSPDSQAQGQPDAAPALQQPDAQPQGQPDAQAQGQPNQTVLPQSLTLPAGTVVRVRIDEWISTDRNVIGDSFSAVLDQPIVVDGWVVARRGQAQTGRVTQVKKAHGGGTSQLGVDLPELTLVDGQQLPLETQLSQTSARSSQDRSWRDRRNYRRDVHAGQAGRDCPGNSPFLPLAGARDDLHGEKSICVSTGDAIRLRFAFHAGPSTHGQARPASFALLLSWSVSVRIWAVSICILSSAIFQFWILRRLWQVWRFSQVSSTATPGCVLL
jgi:hypothetical protein